MLTIQDLITDNQISEKFKNDAICNDKKSLNYFLDKNEKRILIGDYLFNKHKDKLSQEITFILKWLWKEFAIEIKSFSDLLNLKESPIKDYYQYIYIIYIQLLLTDLQNNTDTKIKPNLIKGNYNSFYAIDDTVFVPDTYYDVIKTELFYKLSILS